MAFSNIDNLQLGKFLQIAFSEGIRNQISTDFRDWEMVKRHKVADPLGRELRFFFQKSLGPSAVQRRNPNGSSAFPSAQKVSTEEFTAVTKELNATIEIEQNLLDRLELSKDVRYADALQVEMESKMLATKRQLAKELYGDGSGVIAEVLTGGQTVSGGKLVFLIDNTDSARGFIGFAEYDEILVLRAEDGTASSIDTDLGTEPAYWRVDEIDRDAGTLTLQGLDSSLAEVAIASVTTPAAAGEVFYKYGQPSIPDLTSVSDYGTVSEAMPGLESLASADGRVVHGITMSGSTAASVRDNSAAALDANAFEQALNKAKIRVGAGRYSWKMAAVAPETYSDLVNTTNADRRFHVQESKDSVGLGARKWSFQHREDSVELYSSEYVPFQRIFILPESKSGQGKVLEYHGTDFSAVKTGTANDMILKSGGSGYERAYQMFLKGYGTLIAQHPAAIAVIKNFS